VTPLVSSSPRVRENAEQIETQFNSGHDWLFMARLECPVDIASGPFSPSTHLPEGRVVFPEGEV